MGQKTQTLLLGKKVSSRDDTFLDLSVDIGRQLLLRACNSSAPVRRCANGTNYLMTAVARLGRGAFCPQSFCM